MSTESSQAALMLFSLIQQIQRYGSEKYGNLYKVNSQSRRQLSERQYFILFCIHFLNYRTSAEIGALMHRSASSVSLVVSKMEKNGYILKNHDAAEGDKRKIILTLTEAGLDTLKTLTDEILFECGRFYDSLDKRQRADFGEGLRLIFLAFPEADTIRIP